MTAFLRKLQSSGCSAATATSGRRTVLHLSKTGRWTKLLVSMITTLRKLPAPATLALPLPRRQHPPPVESTPPGRPWAICHTQEPVALSEWGADGARTRAARWWAGTGKSGLRWSDTMWFSPTHMYVVAACRRSAASTPIGGSRAITSIFETVESRAGRPPAWGVHARRARVWITFKTRSDAVCSDAAKDALL